MSVRLEAEMTILDGAFTFRGSKVQGSKVPIKIKRHQAPGARHQDEEKVDFNFT
jgi:hypothetical protein